MIRTSILALVMTSLFSTAAWSAQSQESFVDPNTLTVPANFSLSNEMTYSVFNAAISRVEEIYRPIFASMGKRLIVHRYWHMDEVNAYASDYGYGQEITINGGLARYRGMTFDSLILAACHEIGHHVGAAPYFGESIAVLLNGGDHDVDEHMSVEGESDYFASLKCFRLVFEKDDNIEYVKSVDIAPDVRVACESVYSDPRKAALCMRSIRAAADLKMLTEDAVVARIQPTKPDLIGFSSHPPHQCRMDTFVAGALCDVDPHTPVGDDPTQGACSLASSLAAAGSVLEARPSPLGARPSLLGARPMCWYGVAATLYEIPVVKNAERAVEKKVDEIRATIRKAQDFQQKLRKVWPR